MCGQIRNLTSVLHYSQCTTNNKIDEKISVALLSYCLQIYIYITVFYIQEVSGYDICSIYNMNSMSNVSCVMIFMF